MVIAKDKNSFYYIDKNWSGEEQKNTRVYPKPPNEILLVWTECLRALAKRPIITNIIRRWNTVSFCTGRSTRMINAVKLQRKSNREAATKKKKKYTHTQPSNIIFYERSFQQQFIVLLRMQLLFLVCALVHWVYVVYMVCFLRNIYVAFPMYPTPTLSLSLNCPLCIFILYRFGCSFPNTHTKTVVRSKSVCFMTFFFFSFLFFFFNPMWPLHRQMEILMPYIRTINRQLTHSFCLFSRLCLALSFGLFG